MKKLYELLSRLFSKRVRELELELAEKEETIQLQADLIGDPRSVVERCFEKGVEWYDFNEMDTSSLRKYYAEAQLIINSDVWKNEKNRLIAMGSVECVKQHVPGSPVDSVRDFQMTINGMELLEEQFKSVPDPDYKNKETSFDQFEAI